MVRDCSLSVNASKRSSRGWVLGQLLHFYEFYIRKSTSISQCLSYNKHKRINKSSFCRRKEKAKYTSSSYSPEETTWAEPCWVYYSLIVLKKWGFQQVYLTQGDKVSKALEKFSAKVLNKQYRIITSRMLEWRGQVHRLEKRTDVRIRREIWNLSTFWSYRLKTLYTLRRVSMVV